MKIQSTSTVSLPRMVPLMGSTLKTPRLCEAPPRSHSYTTVIADRLCRDTFRRVIEPRQVGLKLMDEVGSTATSGT